MFGSGHTVKDFINMQEIEICTRIAFWEKTKTGEKNVAESAKLIVPVRNTNVRFQLNKLAWKTLSKFGNNFSDMYSIKS